MIEAGSSPHVRGFVRKINVYLIADRFIPACAGFCGNVKGEKLSKQVHPRMCGVLGGEVMANEIVQGSSPHVRGFARNRQNRKGF